jgi:hypothetical protein
MNTAIKEVSELFIGENPMDIERLCRLNGPVSFSDWRNAAGSPAAMCREVTQTLSFRGSKSRLST